MDMNDVMMCAREELRRASSKYGAFHNYHEGYAVLKEEVDELWDEIKGNQDKDKLTKEAAHVIAMGMRFLFDLL